MLAYTTVAVEEPTRIVMRADTDAVLSLDTITLSESAGQVHVNYHADFLCLTGTAPDARSENDR